MINKPLITGLAVGVTTLLALPALAGRLRETPISVAPLSIEELPSVDRLGDIATLQPTLGSGTQPKIHLRGVGGDGLGPDGKPLASPLDGGVDVGGLERVEPLRGVEPSYGSGFDRGGITFRYRPDHGTGFDQGGLPAVGGLDSGLGGVRFRYQPDHGTGFGQGGLPAVGGLDNDLGGVTFRYRPAEGSGFNPGGLPTKTSPAPAASNGGFELGGRYRVNSELAPVAHYAPQTTAPVKRDVGSQWQVRYNPRFEF